MVYPKLVDFVLQDSVRCGLTRRQHSRLYLAMYDMIKDKHMYVGCTFVDAKDGSILGQVIAIVYFKSTYTAFVVHFSEDGRPIYRK